MTVYVDNMENQYGRMKMCHMVADNLEELHAMADAIGLKREWFQDKDPRYPHYDVTKSRKRLAIQNGAVEIGPQELIMVLHEWYKAEGQN